MHGQIGHFTVQVRQHPRYVDQEACLGCGQCAEKCPKKVPDSYNQGLSKRKAISLLYSQTVPLKYAIDPEYCLYLQKGKCRVCESICPTGAINFQDREQILTLEVGSIILAPGFQEYNPKDSDLYNLTRFPDVLTSLQFERVLSATGPFAGELIRPSQSKAKAHPQKIAWLQCVGSRDNNQSGHGYCSSVCCMFAVKQAVMAKEHSRESLDCAIFYMDLRTQGKGFEPYAEKAKEQGVRFIRARPHSVERVPGSEDILLRYCDAGGQPREEVFDLLVLSTGMELNAASVDLFQRLGLALDRDGFVATSSFEPVSSSVPGIFVCGACNGPKDIPFSVMEASAAAEAASRPLAAVRGTAVRTIEIPPEKEVRRQRPRIGVFVCHCGINISGVVDVAEVAAYARGLTDVVHVEENLFTCSQDTQDAMSRIIQEKGLNRVVVAACTPRTHENLFQETLIQAGLNKYLLEMANIRNHDAWVHSRDPLAATAKAKDLVRMSVAKSRLLKPLKQSTLHVVQKALVVGGGAAGLTAALSLARQGFPVDLLEKGSVLGGQARKLFATHQQEDIRGAVDALVRAVRQERRITVHLETRIVKAEGFVGNFSTWVRGPSEQTRALEHGVAILATGARESRPDAYGYGQSDKVVTGLEMDGLLADNDPGLQQAASIVFIQCVGSRDRERPYCSKVCCTHSLVNALECKRRNPKTDVLILYRDIRTYGQREHLYQEARAAGIRFFRYTPEDKPKTRVAPDAIHVEFPDPILGRRVCVEADYVCLAAAVEPRQNKALAGFFKIPLDENGWMAEAHQKLRPVEFPSEGVFLCGLAHFPKPIEESITQAQAAASRALTILSKASIAVGGVVATVLEEWCTGCGSCLTACPFQAIAMDEQAGHAQVNAALCKGCGSCAGACPAEAIVLEGFSNQQLYAQIDTVLKPEPLRVPAFSREEGQAEGAVQEVEAVP